MGGEFGPSLINDANTIFFNTDSAWKNESIFFLLRLTLAALSLVNIINQMVFAVIFFVCFIVVCSISSRHDDNFCKRNWSLFFHPYNEIMRALLHLNKKEKFKFLMFFDHLHSSVITIRLSKCFVSFQYDTKRRKNFFEKKGDFFEKFWKEPF